MQKNKALSQLTDQMIGTSAPEGCPIEALIVFPKAEGMLVPQPLGHFKCIALMRLTDETLWMLTMPGQAWTSDRLRAAANALVRLSENAYTKRLVDARLRRELKIEGVSLEQPAIGSIDPHRWGVEAIAFAVEKRNAATRRSGARPVSDVTLGWSDIASAIQRGLVEALRAFCEGLDPAARRIASASGGFNARVYNYLAHESYRKYRIQFAETFPSLLLTAVLGERGKLGAEVRAVVDTGAPLVKTLAKRWNVRPGVVRHLAGRSSRHVGLQWERDAVGLALTLNALRPQDVPGDDADEWSRFNRSVVIGQRLFCERIWESDAALEWLRECASRAQRGTERARKLWLPDWSQLPGIIRFRDALSASVAHQVPNSASNEIVEAVDWTMLKLAKSGLANTASEFEEALAKIRIASKAGQIVAGAIMLPLIPEDYVTTQGDRLVRPLTTAHELRSHGIKLRNCLRNRYTDDALRKGATGRLFIIGTFDPGTKKALSTVEIKVAPTREKLTHRFIITQHTAMANRKPSPPCRQAIQELLQFCQTAKIQKYLADNWRRINNAQSGGLRSMDHEESVEVTRALKQVMGEDVYRDLVDRIRFG